MIKSLLTLTATALLLAGCSSTSNTSSIDHERVSYDTPPRMPESYQTMIDFRIIDRLDANRVVNGQRQVVQMNRGKFGKSLTSQITNDGKMFVGFGLAQLFGGGVALLDFFSPLSLLTASAHENHLVKSFLWVPVDDDCDDEECGYQKIYEVLSLAAQHYADNYMKLLATKIDTVNPGPAIITPLEVVVPPSPKLNILFQKVSKSYKTDFLNLEDKFDVSGNGRPFFTVWDADFTTVKGKRYFGSKVVTKELFTVQSHKMGQYQHWWYDNSLTLGLAKASETYPGMIYVETQNFIDQTPANAEKPVTLCQGDLMITQGKLTYMHLFPNCDPIKLEESNLINVQIHDARSEILTDEEWLSMSSTETSETASN